MQKAMVVAGVTLARQAAGNPPTFPGFTSTAEAAMPTATNLTLSPASAEVEDPPAAFSFHAHNQ